MNGDRRVLTPSEAANGSMTAQLSSVERSRLLDLIVADISALAKQVNALTKANAAIVSQLREHRAILDAHSGIVLRPSRWARLRRVLGC